MSREIDEKVVEMRFDNSQFESNVKTTMSTLDRLKAALKFPSKTDGLDAIANGAKNVSSGIGNVNNSVGSLRASFSALQVIGVTALANITNQAVNAGKRIASALTIQPLSAGFQEYETQMNSIQTILSNTQSKGTTIEDVTAALDELNAYADKTIYNFTEMTRNIGTFTAAGLGLDESVSAIKGIANLAAVSGSTSQQASVAMYQLSQALANGRVALMDWNSVVNAGMGGEVFQEALKRTARNMGIAVDDMVKKYGSFRESLTKGGWLTADVLSETLAQISGAYSEADLASQGYNQEQIQQIMQLAQTAEDAATKVTTFTKLMETLGEALGSGWTNTWETIFGDFYEAREFWTGISEALGNLINASAEARNSLLGGAFDSPWQKLEDEITEAGGSFSEFEEAVKTVAKEHGIAIDEMISEQGSLQKVISSGALGSDLILEAFGRLGSGMNQTTQSTEDLNAKLQEMQSIVDRVWRGDFGNGAERMERLAEAGYDYAEVQALVNATVDGHRLTIDELSDSQLENIGYTEEEIATLRELQAQAAETGTPINELINNLSRPSGRELFFQSVHNILQAVLKPLGLFSDAWNDIFTIESSDIYNALVAFEEFTSKLEISGEDFANLNKTIRGALSALHLLSRFLGGGFSLAFSVISNVLGLFGTNLLEVTGQIGVWVTQLDQSVSSGNLFLDVLRGLRTILNAIAPGLGSFIDEMLRLSGLETILSGVAAFFSPITEYASELSGMTFGDAIVKMLNDVRTAISKISWEDVLDGLSDFGSMVGKAFDKVVELAEEVGPDILAGLQNGLKDGLDTLVDVAVEIGTKIIEAIKALLGIHSPSTVFFEIGVNIIQGLVNGIKYMVGAVVDVAKYIVNSIGDVFADVDWVAVLGIAGGIGLFVILYRMTTAFQTLATAAKNATDPLRGVSQIFGGFATVMNSFGAYLKEKKWTTRANAILTLAAAIAILVGAVVVLSQIDQEGLERGVVSLIAIAAALTLVILALGNFGASDLGDVAKLGTTLFGLSALVGVMALAMKGLSELDPAGMERALSAITLLSIMLAVIMGMTKIMGNEAQLAKMTSFFLSLGASLLLMSASVKLLGGMDPGQLGQAVATITWFSLIIAGFMALTRIMGTGDQLKSIGDIFKNIGLAFVLLGVAIRIIGSTDPGQLTVGLTAITYMTLIMAALMAATRLAASKDLFNVGTTILAVSGAFILMAAAAKILGTMNPEELSRGTKFIAAFAGIISALMVVTRVVGGGVEIAKLGGTILAISVAIGILAGVAILLGRIDTKSLVKGVVIVGVLSLIIDGMVLATKNAKDVKGTMIGIAIAIGTLAAAIAILSFIDTKKLLGASVAMGIVLTALAGVAAAVAKMQGGKGMIGNIAVLALMLGAVTGVLMLMSSLNVEASIPNAIALAALMLALSASARIIGSSGDAFNAKQLAMIGTLVGAMTLLSGVIAILSVINPQNVLPNAVALSALLIALSAAVKIMGNMVVYKPGNIAGVIGAVVVAMYALTGLLAILSTFDASGAIPNVIGLGLLLAEMTAVTFALSKMGAVDPVAVSKAALALDAVTGIVGAMVAVVGALNQLTQGGLADVMASGGEVFEEFGNAIGSFIGGIVGGLAEGIMGGIGDGLVDFGKNLSMFMLAIQPFLMGLRMITPDMTTAASNLAGALLELSTASLIDGLAGWINGGTDWSKLGPQMAALGIGLALFTTAVSGVDLARAKVGSEALKNVITAMSEIPSTGGLLQGLLGGKDYTDFADGMGEIGLGLQKFDAQTNGITADTIGPAASALQTIISTFAQIPNSGGFLQDLIGGQDYEGFANGMESIAKGLVNFVTEVNKIESYDSVKMATDALRTVIETLSTIPADGGLLGEIFGGDINYENFAEGLKAIGDALFDYSSSVSDLNYENMETAITRLNQLLTVLKTNKDVGDTFAESIANIEKISGIGDALHNFYTKIDDVDTSILNSAVGSILRLTNAISDMANLNTSGVATFQAAIADLAETDTSAIVSAFENVDFHSIGVDMAQRFASGFSAGRTYISNAASSTALIMYQNLAEKVTDFSEIGKSYAENLGRGIDKSVQTVINYAKGVAEAAANSLRGYYGSFYNSGFNAAKGFADGISGGSFYARINARAMANAAANAARAALDEHSPSRVFYAIGEFAGMGMANALNAYASVCGKAGSNMADEAATGLRSGMNSVVNQFDDLNMNPTIRPVMDLSDIQNGVNYINTSLSGMANSNIIGQASRLSRAFSSNRQNGTTDDVIRELSKLRGDIQTMPVNQYTVNGITYDDGTAIAGSVQELIRATRIERRR